MKFAPDALHAPPPRENTLAFLQLYDILIAGNPANQNPRRLFYDDLSVALRAADGRRRLCLAGPHPRDPDHRLFEHGVVIVNAAEHTRRGVVQYRLIAL